jgi:hypothetical protein
MLTNVSMARFNEALYIATVRHKTVSCFSFPIFPYVYSTNGITYVG